MVRFINVLIWQLVPWATSQEGARTQKVTVGGASASQGRRLSRESLSMGKGNGGERPATDGGAPLNASFQGPEAITFSRAPRVLKRTAAAPLREALAFTHWP